MEYFTMERIEHTFTAEAFAHVPLYRAKACLKDFDMTLNKTPGVDEWKLDYRKGTICHIGGEYGTAYFALSVADAMKQAFNEKIPYQTAARNTARQARIAA